MNGTNQGELRLHVLEDIGAGFDAPVWVLYGNQGNYWKRASLNIQAPLPFKVSRGCIEKKKLINFIS